MLPDPFLCAAALGSWRRRLLGVSELREASPLRGKRVIGFRKCRSAAQTGCWWGAAGLRARPGCGWELCPLGTRWRPWLLTQKEDEAWRPVLALW